MYVHVDVCMYICIYIFELLSDKVLFKFLLYNYCVILLDLNMIERAVCSIK